MILHLSLRFMHEPNLPPLRIQLEGPSKDKNIICLDDIRESIPEMPEETRQKLLKEFNMPLVRNYFSRRMFHISSS